MALVTQASAVRVALERRRDVRGVAFRLVLQAGLLLALVTLVLLLITVFADGVGTLTGRGGEFISGELHSQPEQAGVGEGLRGSFWLAWIVAVVAFPLGIGTAVYLEEYAPKNRLTEFVDLNIRNLAGVPSVVYGILGLSVFVALLKRIDGDGVGTTLLAGGLTLAVLVLPIVIITAAEAIRAVPQSLREAAYGVGATKSEVVRGHVLPYAAPAILTGLLLSISRAVGEAAPLILVGAITGRLATDNEAFFDPGQFMDRFTAMPIVITEWATLPQAEFSEDLAAAAIIVLLVFVLVLNAAAILLRNRFEKRRQG